jgi:signal transduction histidine kinase
MLTLRLARARLGPDRLTYPLDQAEDELRRAIEELREVANGIYPAVLADEGLAAAVEALAERSTVSVRVSAIPEERFPDEVEAAAYFFIAEVAGPIASSTRATGVTVEVARVDDRLLVKVTEQGGDAPDTEMQARLVDLADRVGALDGRTDVGEGSIEGRTFQAEIPCGS